MTHEVNSEGFRELLQSGRPFLVEYHAPWCGYCRRLEPAFDRVVREYEGTLTSVKIDIDKEPALADREHIEVVPTLVRYHRGDALGSMVAPESRSRIEEFLEDYLEN